MKQLRCGGAQQQADSLLLDTQQITKQINSRHREFLYLSYSTITTTAILSSSLGIGIEYFLSGCSMEIELRQSIDARD